MTAAQVDTIVEALKKGKVWTRKGATGYVIAQTIFARGAYFQVRGTCANLHGMHVACFDAKSVRAYNKKFPNSPIVRNKKFNLTLV